MQQQECVYSISGEAQLRRIHFVSYRIEKVSKNYLSVFICLEIW